VEDGIGPGIAGTFNCMARGIAFSDLVSTVSPTYAREIMTGEYGERLDGLLRRRRDRVVGILNGIDTVTYDPATDPHLAKPFSVEDTLGKVACKTALQREMGLPVAATSPLLGVVTRLVEQKGLELLVRIAPWLLANTDAQLVLLGSGQEQYEEAFRRMARAYPDRIAARIGFDVPLAQSIYAGSDAFLMPSRFEPCGLGQMIALRYGSVPIVRATGGLNDTVREGFDGNGFRFHEFSDQDFAGAIQRALTTYRDTRSWAILRARGMGEDHSWSNAATQYANMYTWAMKARGQGQ
jgi:starch synthase